ncbi:hypothetical protein [Actinoplanes awajinensis]|uniref:hypothetical protein n=1 Tax=Actinoplanes awajinensis TaxID=135946 RepID=UPI000A8D40FD|nr:hypothetical protein [Actinoplanes awajinensis]
MRIIERLKGRGARVLTAGVITLGLLGPALAIGASPAAAVPSGVKVDIVKSACVGKSSTGKPTISWVGSGLQVPLKSAYVKTRVQGKLFACFWKYKFSDQDRNYDYWGASVETYWVRTDKKGKASYAALANHQISSNKTARGGIFAGTKDYTSKTSCSRQIDVGVSIGAFSASTPIQACSSYKMDQVRASNTAGYWKMPKIGGFTHVETTYMQKVKQGVKPTFSMSANYPKYGYHWSDGASHWVPTVNLKTIFKKF